MMKNNFLPLMLLFIYLVSSSAFGGMLNFSIDKDLFEKMSTSQQSNLIEKVSQLTSFYESQIDSKIPMEIKEKLKNFSVTISFQNKSNRDGLFIPNENHSHKIILSLEQINSNGLMSLIAHEFFHAIHFELNPSEAPWVREGMAQLFEFITTNEFSGINLQAAQINPFTPLIGRYEINDPNFAQYGHDLLYFYYLYSHCGKETLFWKLSMGSEDNIGSKMIDNLLRNNVSNKKECSDFYSSALSFEVAKFHNQTQFNNDNNSDQYFLAPTNLQTKAYTFSSKEKLIEALNNLPIWSSLRIKLDDWREVSSLFNSLKVFYVRKSFPYDVRVDETNLSPKNTEVILVRPSQLGGESAD